VSILFFGLFKPSYYSPFFLPTHIISMHSVDFNTYYCIL
jgi:hypothetical protein